MAPTPVLLPGKSHGWRGLVGCSPWGRYESDMTERLHFIFSLSCIGEGNGNPLQRSCLENPRDGVAWWAAVYGVAQSQTRLRWLSSSSNSSLDVGRFKAQKEVTLPKERKKETNKQTWCTRSKQSSWTISPLLINELSFFVLLRVSTAWMNLTNIREGNLPSLIY